MFYFSLFLLCVNIIILFINEHNLRKYFVTFKDIVEKESIAILDIIKKRLARDESLIDFLSHGCNPIIRSVYHKLKEIPLDQYPENNEQMNEVLRKFSVENFNIQVEILKKQIVQTEEPKLKTFLQDKLDKLYEVKNLTDILGDEHSESYVNIVFSELEKALYELNSGYEDESDIDVY